MAEVIKLFDDYVYGECQYCHDESCMFRILTTNEGQPFGIAGFQCANCEGVFLFEEIVLELGGDTESD